jgi:hypothetical protein
VLEKYAFFYILIRFGAICSLRASGEDMEIIFQRFPSQAKKNNGNSVFKKKDIGIIFQRFPSQAKNKKNTEIPFSNRIYWHYFPEKPKKIRPSRFQMRFPSQDKKNHRYPVFT